MIKLASSRRPLSSFRPVDTMDQGMEGPKIRRVLRCLHSHHDVTCSTSLTPALRAPGKNGVSVHSCVMHASLALPSSLGFSSFCLLRSLWQDEIPSFCPETCMRLAQEWWNAATLVQKWSGPRIGTTKLRDTHNESLEVLRPLKPSKYKEEMMRHLSPFLSQSVMFRSVPFVWICGLKTNQCHVG